MASCALPTCAGPRYARGLCERHYTKERRIRLLRGDRDRVDTAPARKHLHLLRARGWGWQEIAGRARSSCEMMHRLDRGELDVMPRDKAALLVGIEPVWRDTRVPVSTVGTRRRLDALAWQGWSGAEVARQLGLSVYLFPNSTRSHRIEARTAALVAGFYDAHAYTAGPNPAYAKKARAAGAIPAAAWDDIDDPDAVPDLEGQQVRRGGPKRIVHLDDVEHLAGYGMTIPQIAARLGTHPETVKEAVRRARKAGEEAA